MNPLLQQGRLIRWEDDRGFGFIQPDNCGANVFLHISEIRRAMRRPQIGDRVEYAVQTQPNGKIRAINARLLGVPMPYSPPQYTSDGTGIFRVAVGLALIGIAIYVNKSINQNRPPHREQSTFAQNPSGNSSFYSDYQSDTKPQNDSLPPPGFDIKGNISVVSGRKYYHVPGSLDYADTKIDLSRGERWFRTEAEALAGGWTKATPSQGRTR